MNAYSMRFLRQSDIKILVTRAVYNIRYSLVLYSICTIFITCINLNLYMMTIHYCDWFGLGQENKSFLNFIRMHIMVYFITICYYSQYSLKNINLYLLQCLLHWLRWKEYVSLLYWCWPGCVTSLLCSWNVRSGHAMTY